MALHILVSDPMRFLLVASLFALVAGCEKSSVEERGVSQKARYPTAAHHAVTRGPVEYLPGPRLPEDIAQCSRCHEGGAEQKRPREKTAFPHRLHLDNGLECANCHDPNGTGKPSLPSLDTCWMCHEQDPAKQKPKVKAFLLARKQPGGGYAFVSRWKAPDIKPVHQVHAKHQVACTSCHGQPSNEPIYEPKPATLMARCTACHTERKAPVSCETCHEKARGEVHLGTELHHGNGWLTCTSCHTQGNLEMLHLASGEKVPFDKAPRLCGQCHSREMSALEHGFHGKRTGNWDGKKEVLLCLSCHNPHAPRFHSLTPLPPPDRPEEKK